MGRKDPATRHGADVPAAGKPSGAAKVSSRSCSIGNVTIAVQGCGEAALKRMNVTLSSMQDSVGSLLHGAKCARRGCESHSYNGVEGEFCSYLCRSQTKPVAPAQKPATCARSGCQRASWNGKPGECCTVGCRDQYYKEISRFAPDSESRHPGGGLRSTPPQFIPFNGGPVKCAGVLGFYFCGYDAPVDTVCKVPFLGNFFQSKITISPPRGSSATFMNAEAAFQSLKFWDQREKFQGISGGEAFKTKQSLSQWEDRSYAGYNSNWKAMREVLRCKFQDSKLREALVSTGDCFLLEHNSVPNRDATWSNNHDGSGKNWLGLQLMLLRDELSGEFRWTSWIRHHVNVDNGEFFDEQWAHLVKAATETVLKFLDPGSASARHCRGQGHNEKPSEHRHGKSSPWK